METILAMILAAATIAYVGYPLLIVKPEEDVEPAVEETVEDELALQKESTYAAIAELDFDHAMGNLSDDDHQQLRDRYKLKALAIMQQEDEIEKAREATMPPKRRAVPAPTQEGKGSRAFCSGCGARLEPDDRFCATCGKPLASGCPSCGTAHDPDDTFCASCGQKL